jgi:catechol 2,3-dioxygenase
MPQPDYDPGPRIAYAGSINLGTPDLERSLWFFRDLLGMEVVEQVDGVAYLRGYQELVHHSLVFLVPGSEHPFEFYYDIEKPRAEESIRSKILSNSSRRRRLGVRRLDHIYDPDWDALEWKLPELELGQTWYGDVFDVGPGGSFLSTSPSAGLVP